MKSIFKQKYWLILFLLGALSLGGAEYPRYKIGRVYYSRLRDIAADYGFRARRGKTRMEIYNPAARKIMMVFHNEKKFAQVNSTRVALASPAILNGNGSQVSYIDGIKTVRPLLDSGRLHYHRVQTIVLDPGHGGKDQGAAGGGRIEKELNLQLARKVELLLKAKGFRVLLTRRYDRFLSLQQRSAFANARHADLFISIHANSSPTSSPRGIEVFCLSPAGTASSNASAVSWTSYPGNRYDSRNIRLGYFMQTALIRKTQANDMGVKRARFAVLRDLNCPGVLVEMGFLSNPQEAALLRSQEYLDKLAQGIASGILDYCHAMRPPNG